MSDYTKVPRYDREKVKPEWTVIGPNGVEYEVEQAHCGICGASDAIQIRPKREADE